MNGTDPEIFLVGFRWPQHASVSGYDAVGRYVGKFLQLPIKDRGPRRHSPLYWKLAAWLEKVTKPAYSFHILAMELAIAIHMLKRRGAVYHVLYGEVDFWLLGHLGRLTGNNVIASFHDDPTVMRWCGIDDKILRSLSGVMLLGTSQLDYVLNSVPKERVHLVPHGVDVDFFQPDPSRKGRDVICLTVGGHTRDHETLSRAIDLVAARRPEVRFVAVSANVGNKGTHLENPRVEHITGLSDEELRTLYQSSTVAAFAFEFAVANNSILEAMACGVPVVATRTGSVSDYVPEDAGILTAQRDEYALADAIVTVIEDKKRAQKMSAAARSTAEKFALVTVTDLMRDVYRRVASEDSESKRYATTRNDFSKH